LTGEIEIEIFGGGEGTAAVELSISVVGMTVKWKHVGSHHVQTYDAVGMDEGFVENLANNRHV